MGWICRGQTETNYVSFCVLVRQRDKIYTTSTLYICTCTVYMHTIHCVKYLPHFSDDNTQEYALVPTIYLLLGLHQD